MLLYFGQHASHDVLKSTINNSSNENLQIKSGCEVLHLKSIAEENISQAYFGWGICCFITVAGNVYVLNFNDESQKLLKVELPANKKCFTAATHLRDCVSLIITNELECYIYNHLNESLKIILLPANDAKIQTVSVGMHFALLLSNDGLLFEIELSSLKVEPISFPAKTIVTQVVCGHEHWLALDDNGTVFSCGSGRRGQLGHGSSATLLIPQAVEALEGIIVSKIAAGGWHSAAITSIGDLYIWGWNENSQLGLNGDSKQSICFIPELVTFPSIEGKEESIKDVACGSRHTVALSSEGSLWVWGWNAYGQLGIEPCNVISTPFLLKLISYYSCPRAVKAYHWSTMIHFND